MDYRSRIDSQSMASVAIVIVAFLEDGGGSDNVVGGRLAAGGLYGYAERQALPLGGLAYRDEVIGLWPSPEELLDDRSTGSELGDYDVEAGSFGGGGGAAVGGVVAKPDGVGDEGIEVGEMER